VTSDCIRKIHGCRWYGLRLARLEPFFSMYHWFLCLAVVFGASSDSAVRQVLHRVATLFAHQGTARWLRVVSQSQSLSLHACVMTALVHRRASLRFHYSVTSLKPIFCSSWESMDCDHSALASVYVQELLIISIRTRLSAWQFVLAYSHAAQGGQVDSSVSSLVQASPETGHQSAYPILWS